MKVAEDQIIEKRISRLDSNGERLPRCRTKLQIPPNKKTAAATANNATPIANCFDLPCSLREHALRAFQRLMLTVRKTSERIRTNTRTPISNHVSPALSAKLNAGHCRLPKMLETL